MSIVLTALYFIGVVIVLAGMFNDYMNMDLDKHFGGLAATAVLALLWPGFLLFATGYYIWISFTGWNIRDN